MKDRGLIKWTPAFMMPEQIKLLKQVEIEDMKIKKPVLDEQEITYRNNVIFILVAERCVEVLVCMCFKVLKTLKIGCTEKPHLLKL